jgi:3-oxoadipate enol-lactonase
VKWDDRDGGFEEVSGARLYFEISGRGEPVVLVHAGIADHRMWDPQVAALASAYQVLNYDMRGFGRSGMAGGPYSHHGDLRDLLNHLASWWRRTRRATWSE